MKIDKAFGVSAVPAFGDYDIQLNAIGVSFNCIFHEPYCALVPTKDRKQIHDEILNSGISNARVT